eukprot:5542891-Amphidinium_carterae.1
MISWNCGIAVLRKFTKVGEVATITLDDVVMNLDPLPYIHLAKVDAQGFEVCRLTPHNLTSIITWGSNPWH